MSDEYEAKKSEAVTRAGISLLFSKSIKGTPGLTSPSGGRIIINSTYAFISCTLRRDLGFNSDIFGRETSD
jgi:hypothetical protein